MRELAWVMWVAAAFLSGSVPFGLLIGRRHGLDIRRHGSGNIGAANVFRVLGPRAGALCFVLDVLKGFAPTLAAGIAMDLVPGTISAAPISGNQASLWLLVTAAPVLGHMFSPWMGFRGGKGVATGLGALLGVYPYLTVPALAALGVWGLVAAATRYSSLASCLAAVSMPAWVYLWTRAGWMKWTVGEASGSTPDHIGHRPYGYAPFFVVTGAMALIVIWKHRANIRRMLAGREPKLGQRVKVRSAASA